MGVAVDVVAAVAEVVVAAVVEVVLVEVAVAAEEAAPWTEQAAE